VNEHRLSAHRLERLTTSAEIADRALAAGALRLGLHDLGPDAARALYEDVRQTALGEHEEVRLSIREGALDAGALIARVRSAPLELRDHLVEEIFDIAYPPLDAPLPPAGGVGYVPSGIAEILFVLEHAGLEPDKTFVDLGSGMGKVVLSLAALSGARAVGIEIDSVLLGLAGEAASSLRLERVSFVAGDIREAPVPPADVYYLYLPVARPVDVVARLEPIARERPIRVFASGLDLGRLPWLHRAAASSYWLEMYESAS
jgi:hypothetical protein